ncbi:heme utilization cystosolic carrier protein HutX [Marinobacter salexigens]|uniref:Heme utilization cystosolic carrier protein HutX n=1 Tax=Marinobacter salexigens TaxID=1925763 RepID=A0ABS6A5S0_9GAMM|nr:heme utilization cystosolic carrier protein HutX [Marinobacter salexigens]MBU2873040.1 heme utilization cystosolic carrier protein HutX [Marinobacter salexigens]
MSSTSSDKQDSIATLKARLAESGDGILENIAAEHQLSLMDVIQCLPNALWTRVRGEHFTGVMNELAEWGLLNIIVHTEDAIIEVQSQVPEGSLGHGYYNLKGGHPLSGHLKPDRITDIVFLTRPFMGVDTASIQFLNGQGKCAFKVYVGRDETRSLRQDQLKHFHSLKNRLSAAATEAAPC